MTKLNQCKSSTRYASFLLAATTLIPGNLLIDRYGAKLLSMWGLLQTSAAQTDLLTSLSLTSSITSLQCLRKDNFYLIAFAVNN